MSDLSGKTLGKYQIIERLGRGGMASVYKAYQPGLDRYVAVKVMHPHLSEQENFIERFKREARTVSSLRHPNIVNVFDTDVQGELNYMVMDYVDGGETLKEVLIRLSDEGTGLSIEQSLVILEKVSDALAYAHEKGMVHRDIKPANILMPSLDNPMVADFGIAHIIGDSGLTASGAMIGTPAYMSPEQGRGEKADTRSDIYALGIVFYEMITGHPPYEADTPYGIILKHINEPLPIAKIAIDSLPDSVNRILLRCLAKNPDDRFQSASELKEVALQAAAPYEGETPVSDSTPTKLPVSTEPALSLETDKTVISEDPPAGVASPVSDVSPVSDDPPPVKTEEEAVKMKPKIPTWAKWLVAAVLVMTIIGGGGFLVFNYFTEARYENRANRLFWDQGNLEGAVALLEIAYNKSGNLGYLEEAAGFALLAEDYELALAYYDWILVETNNEPWHMVGQGYILLKSGDIDDALERTERALAFEPDLLNARYLNALILIESGAHNEGFDLLRQLEPYDTWEYNQPFFNTHFGHSRLFDMAYAKYLAGDIASTLTYIDLALDEEYWWIPPYLLRSDIYVDEGNLRLAREDLLQALDIAEDFGDADMIEELQNRLARLGDE